MGLNGWLRCARSTTEVFGSDVDEGVIQRYCLAKHWLTKGENGCHSVVVNLNRKGESQTGVKGDNVKKSMTTSFQVRGVIFKQIRMLCLTRFTHI